MKKLAYPHIVNERYFGHSTFGPYGFLKFDILNLNNTLKSDGVPNDDEGLNTELLNFSTFLNTEEHLRLLEEKLKLTNFLFLVLRSEDIEKIGSILALIKKYSLETITIILDSERSIKNNMGYFHLFNSYSIVQKESEVLQAIDGILNSFLPESGFGFEPQNILDIFSNSYFEVKCLKGYRMEDRLIPIPEELFELKSGKKISGCFFSYLCTDDLYLLEFREITKVIENHFNMKFSDCDNLMGTLTGHSTMNDKFILTLYCTYLNPNYEKKERELEDLPPWIK